MPEVNELAVLVSSLLALAVGSIWYSPLVFGKHWQRVAGLNDSDLELPMSSQARSLVIGILSNIVLMYVIALLLRMAQFAEMSRTSLVLLLIGLFASFLASVVVWEQKHYMYFVIHAGYGALVVLVGSTIISLWPW